MLAALVAVAPALRGSSASSADVPDPIVAGPDGLAVGERQVSGDMVVDWLEAPPADVSADHGDHADHATEEPTSYAEAASTSGVPTSATPGQGFAVFSPSARWLPTGYTIRLAGGDARVEQLRDELVAAAQAATTATGLPVRVAAGRIASTAPSRGDITVAIGEGACGSAAAGCGGPALTSTELISGHIWIAPSTLAMSSVKLMNVVTHELGHALGLQHYSASWNDGRQVMYPVVSGTATFRAGDVAGLRFVAGVNDRPAGSVTGGTYAAGLVHLTGTLASGSRVRVTVGNASTDVSATAGRVSAEVPAGAGVHLVCATSLDAAAGFRRALGCSQVTAPGQPFGVIEAASNSFETIRIGGWAIDPQTAAPVKVEVRRNGTVVLTASAAGAHPTVATAHAPYGSAHGYTLDVPAAGGTNEVCVRILGVGGGGDKDLGCRKVEHPVDPVGAFEITPSSDLAETISGWALDPNTPSPVNVIVTIDGAASVLPTSAADDRPDVARRYPAHGPAHGFSKGLLLTPGDHEVCLTVTNVGLGTDRVVGCVTVHVGASTGLADVTAALGSLPGAPEVNALVASVALAI